jgi:hypothetical protein
MEKGLIMEVIVADDYWQFSVDHAINEVMKASQTPTELRISAFQARAIAELMAGTNVSDKAHGEVTPSSVQSCWALYNAISPYAVKSRTCYC